MKNSTKIIVALVLALIFLNNFNLDFNKQKELPIDKYQSEGYVAYIVNSESINQDDEIKKCECKGSKEIIHGDGHRTPCPCDVCTCEKEKIELQIPQKEEEEEQDKKKIETVDNNTDSNKKENVYKSNRRSGLLRRLIDN